MADNKKQAIVDFIKAHAVTKCNRGCNRTPDILLMSAIRRGAPETYYALDSTKDYDVTELWDIIGSLVTSD